MNAPATFPPAAPLFLDPACAALLAYEAADAAFNDYIKTGQGDRRQLVNERITTYAAYLRACRRNVECKQ